MKELGESLFRSMSFITSNATQLLVGVALIIAMVNIPLNPNPPMDRDGRGEDSGRG